MHFDKFHKTTLEIADLANIATSVPASDDEQDSRSLPAASPFNIFHSGGCTSVGTTQGSASLVLPPTLSHTVRANQEEGLEDNDETGLLRLNAQQVDDTNYTCERHGATAAVERAETCGAEKTRVVHG